VAAASTPSIDARGVWFNFRVLPIHEPGAEWPLGLHGDAQPAAVLAPTSAAFLLGHFFDPAHNFVELLDPKALLFAGRINVGHDSGWHA
jgi:hypothetical protein